MSIKVFDRPGSSNEHCVSTYIVTAPDVKNAFSGVLFVERIVSESTFFHELELKLNYTFCGNDGAISNGYFSAYYDSASVLGGNNISDEVSITGGDVILNAPKGMRIGCLLMNEVVKWVKQWPDAKVNRITIIEGDASEENKDRRNRFYERFGVVFSYRDDKKEAGRSVPMRVSLLTENDSFLKKNGGNIEPIDFFSYLAQKLHRTNMKIQDLDASNKHMLRDLKRHYENPVKFAFACYKDRVVVILYLIGFILFIALSFLLRG